MTRTEKQSNYEGLVFNPLTTKAPAPLGLLLLDYVDLDNGAVFTCIASTSATYPMGWYPIIIPSQKPQQLYKSFVIEPYFNGFCTVFRYYKEGIEPSEEKDGDKASCNFETANTIEDCKTEIDFITDLEKEIDCGGL